MKRTSKPSSSSAAKAAAAPPATLAELIKRKGLALGDIAPALGTTKPRLSLISNGRQTLPPGMLAPLAKAIGESVRETELLYWSSVEHEAGLMKARAKAEKSRIQGS